MSLFNFFKKKTSKVEFKDWTKIAPKEFVDQILSEIKKNPQATKEDVILSGYGEFGLERTNPIPTFGIPSKEYYLQKLRTSDKRRLRYRRVGSINVENIYNPVDEYELFNLNGETIAFLYFSAYHLSTSTRAPFGFYFEGESNKNIADSNSLIDLFSQNSKYEEYQREVWNNLEISLQELTKKAIELKKRWPDLMDLLRSNNIHTLYHFTERSNLKSIKKYLGLYSWHYCETKKIKIPNPGGNNLSRELDTKKGLQNYVRLSFTKNHPMMFVDPIRSRDNVILELELDVIFWHNTMFSDKNANRNDAKIGTEIDDFKNIRLGYFKEPNHFRLNEDERPYYQAEVLINEHIPIEYIRNLEELMNI